MKLSVARHGFSSLDHQGLAQPAFGSTNALIFGQFDPNMKIPFHENKGKSKRDKSRYRCRPSATVPELQLLGPEADDSVSR